MSAKSDVIAAQLLLARFTCIPTHAAPCVGGLAQTGPIARDLWNTYCSTGCILTSNQLVVAECPADITMYRYLTGFDAA
jgi:hypothetical protein